MHAFEIIGFDADDTLWENERLYLRAQAKLRDLLKHYLADERLDERLYATEIGNLEHFGYGIKAFTLSMIETAIELTDARISAADIREIVNSSKQMLAADVELLDNVAETLAVLAVDHALMLITKGDLVDQERKIARSGLSHYFRYVEIVSNKSPETYRAILARKSIVPKDFLMVGNSLRSDILPVLELGGSAVYIPQELTWIHEAAESPSATQPGFHQLKDFGELPGLLEDLEL